MSLFSNLVVMGTKNCIFTVRVGLQPWVLYPWAQRACGYWSSPGCSPGNPGQKELSMPWLSEFRQTQNLRDTDYCPPYLFLKWERWLIWGRSGVQVYAEEFPNEPLCCFSPTHFYFSFPGLPDVLVCSMWHNRFSVYKILMCNNMNLCTNNGDGIE